MIKIKDDNISYTKDDTFNLKVYPKYKGAFEEGMQLRLIIAQTEESGNIIDKTFDINDELYFVINLSSSERARLNIGDYIYKMTLIKNNSVVTQKSGYFTVKWGA